MRIIPILAALTLGLFATAAVAQKDPGSAPAGVSSTGGKPQKVNPAEVKRENAIPGGPTGKVSSGKPQKVDPAEVKRENAIPGGK